MEIINKIEELRKQVKGFFDLERDIKRNLINFLISKFNNTKILKLDSYITGVHYYSDFEIDELEITNCDNQNFNVFAYDKTLKQKINVKDLSIDRLFKLCQEVNKNYD